MNTKLHIWSIPVLVATVLLMGQEAHAQTRTNCTPNLARIQNEVSERMNSCSGSGGTPEPSGNIVAYGQNCEEIPVQNIRCVGGSGNYGGGSYGQGGGMPQGGGSRDRATDGACANAGEFDGHGGYKCQRAETTIRDIRSRSQIMQQAQTVGAAAMSVRDSAQTAPQTQTQAIQRTQQNLKMAMVSGAVELATNLQGANELSGAESDARSSERGIRNARRELNDALTTARTSGGTGLSDRLSRNNDIAGVRNSIQQDITRAQQNPLQQMAIPANATPEQRTQIEASNRRVAEMQDQRIANLRRQEAGANAFGAKLQETGLDETARGFNSFDQMNTASRRGITESQEIAQQASNAATTTRMTALSNALQLAQTAAAYRQTRQSTATLASLAPPPAPIALGDPGRAPVVPTLSSGNATAPTTPELDNNGAFTDAPANGRMQGSLINGGGGGGGAAFKGARATVSSGGGGRGISGGGGGGSGKGGAGNRNANAITSMDYDAGSGRYINNAGGGAGAGGNSDVQDALAAILGGGEQTPAERSREFRELASVEEGANGGHGEQGPAENRTIFERVSDKYGEVMSRGDIRMAPLGTPTAG